MTTTKFGILAECFGDDPRGIVAQARATGFAGVLFDAYAPNLDVPSLSGTGRREFRHVLDVHGEMLVGLRADPGPKGLGPGADIDRLLAGFDAVFRAAADLRAGVVCVDLGPLPAPLETAPARSPIKPEEAGLIIIPAKVSAVVAREPAAASPDPALLSHVDTALAAVGAIAERYRVSVAMSSSLASFAALHRALAAAGCPWFGIDLDPVALLSDRWTIDETFSRLGHLIRHVRARDAIVGSDRRTKPAEIGRGSVKWAELFAALNGAGYGGWVTIDTSDQRDPPSAAAAALATLLKVAR